MSGYVPNNRDERPVPQPAPYEGDFDKQPPRPLVVEKPKAIATEVPKAGCVFAKSCNLPDGVIDHSNPGGFVPLEPLKDYGDWAVLATAAAVRAGGTPLQMIGGSTSAVSLGSRIGGALSLGLAESAGALAGGAVLGAITLLLPNTSLATDSAFYTKEQYQALEVGRTRVRVQIKHLVDGSVDAYGFYTGRNPSWENVPVIAATARGEQFAADIGQGIEVIWTPAADPNQLGIPALEPAPKLPTIWVYPSAEQADKVLVNPVLPPDYQDAIIWFPATDIPAIYVVLSVRNEPGVVTGVGQDVVGIWLADAGKALGSPIPTRIADKMRGREFSRFDDFREAFWMEVAADPELSSQFSASNRVIMRDGGAPFVIQTEAVGGRQLHEIHHVERIVDGGAVYDVDNLRVTTPKNHIRIHTDNK
ncbi:S-type pyocin domain-containing protein [Pseudomonas sp. GD03944]|uniref:S-type pyocin domain-containing protein n=1 Tax=Pseudomonas sp. GD03944 TaxID=2975409 RepID=UPI00244921F0|nr:S-type pyocin domain-containing protein [Pseudomonas sp. GD03944]MDH1264387.1 S-type pyocin domain-containing protein [Pseudomonas sp. GD03944]